MSNTGTWMQRVAQDWLVLNLTHGSGTALGITTGLQFLPLLLFGLYGGVVADRYRKRRVLVITQAAMGALALVLGLLAIRFDLIFVWITLAALASYIVFTISVTEWRTRFRRRMNELDSQAHTRAVDSLLNYETVKYFNNEDFEARRYDTHLEQYRRAALKSQMRMAADLGLYATPSYVLGNSGILGHPGAGAMAKMIASVRRCDRLAC